MEIIVINLDRSPDRLAFMSKQLERLGLSFTRLSATDGSSLSDQEVRRLGRKWLRPLERNEVACLVSHSRAWRMISEQDKSALILEDDAYLSDRLPTFLKELDQAEPFEIINLETRGHAKYVSRQPVRFLSESSVALHHLEIDRGGAAAYIVSPSAARKLLARLNKKAALADAFMNLRSDIVREQADPGLAAPFVEIKAARKVRLVEMAFGTTIHAPGRGLAYNLRQLLFEPHFKVRRLRDNVSAFFRKLALQRTSVKRPISPCPSILTIAGGGDHPS